MPTAKRERTHECQSLYVRRCQGAGVYQGRLWVGTSRKAGWSINIGCYPSEEAAAAAVRAAVRRLPGGPLDPLTVWRAIKPLVGTVLPAKLLPMHVRKRGDEYVVQLRRGGQRTELGPFATPEAACAAALAWKSGDGGSYCALRV